MTASNKSSPLFTVLVTLALAATLVIVVLSAHIRLDKAGAGCVRWPECFGARVVETSAFAPPTIASRTHRVVASVLAIAVIALALVSLRGPRCRLRAVLAWLAFLITVFLAVLGVYTPGAMVPAVVVGNLLGGFLLSAVLWWLYLELRPRTDLHVASAGLRLGLLTGLGLTLLSVFAGAVAAAYLAGAACTADCPSLPDTSVLLRTDLFAPLPPASERQEIASSLHVLHRGLGLLTTIALLAIAWRVRQASFVGALTLSGLALAQAGLGLTQVWFSMPLLVAVAHNAVGAALLLALLATLHRLRP